MNQQSESVYEAEYLDIYDTAIRTSPADVKSSDPKSSVVKRNKSKSRSKKILWLTCLLTTLVFAVCVIALLAVLLNRQTSISSMLRANEISRPVSCLELKQSGVRSSGIHQIQLPDEHIPIEVFCDMETDDGGWSLVASIHESDISEKCSFNDRWSSYAPNAETYRGKTNWENSMTFGEVRKCLHDDYKNAVFYKLSTSDVMLWHVPSFLPISQARNASTLRYRTTNKFLGRYGANLRNLFRDHFPLKPVSGPKGGTNSMKSLISSLIRIKYEINGWHNYPVPQKMTKMSGVELFPGVINRVVVRQPTRPYGAVTPVRQKKKQAANCKRNLLESIIQLQTFALRYMVDLRRSINQDRPTDRPKTINIQIRLARRRERSISNTATTETKVIATFSQKKRQRKAPTQKRRRIVTYIKVK